MRRTDADIKPGRDEGLQVNEVVASTNQQASAAEVGRLKRETFHVLGLPGSRKLLADHSRSVLELQARRTVMRPSNGSVRDVHDEEGRMRLSVIR